MVWNERMISEGTDVPGRTEVNHTDTQSTLSKSNLKANAEMVPNIPSCHYMLLM